MRKIALGGLALVAASVTACNPTTNNTTPTDSPAPAPSIVASAPDATQLKNNMREWHRTGGDKIEVPLTVDLELAHAQWRGDDAKRQVLTDSVVKDTKAAMNYGPVPDDAMEKDWVLLLTDLKLAGQALQAADYDKATADFQAADKEYKKVYDRNQAIFAGK